MKMLLMVSSWTAVVDGVTDVVEKGTTSVLVIAAGGWSTSWPFFFDLLSFECSNFFIMAQNRVRKKCVLSNVLSLDLVLFCYEAHSVCHLFG